MRSRRIGPWSAVKMGEAMSKSDNKIQVTPEQREALGQYQRDFRAALPHIAELATAVDAPVWNIVQNPKPEGAQDKPQLWSVGHAKVNYVDHIETTNDEGTQGK
jgi:hypothetical protein